MKTNVIILAAESQDDTKYPRCLVEYDGMHVLQHIFKNLSLKDNCTFTFVFHNETMKRHHLDSIASVLVQDAKIVSVSGNTLGSACTSLFAACQLDQDYPLLVISTNEIVNINYQIAIDNFINTNCDGGVLVFQSMHPRYSFVRIENNYITEVAQQNPISDQATSGSFWYNKTYEFVSAAKDHIRKGSTTANKFYIAPTFNQLILKQKKIGFYNIDGKYIPLKTDDYLNN